MPEPWEMAEGYDTETTISIGLFGSRAAVQPRGHADESVVITILLTNAAE